MSHPPSSVDRIDRLRPIRPSDHDRVVALNDAEVPRVSRLGGAGLAAHLPRCDLAVAAVDDAGDLAGFVLAIAPGTAYDSVNYRWFERRGTDHLYVDRVVVAATHRRRGVAGALYDAVAARGRATGREEVTCEVNVDPPNDGSLAFHAARGFVEVGRQHAGHDDVTVGMLVHRLDGPSGGSSGGWSGGSSSGSSVGSSGR